MRKFIILTVLLFGAYLFAQQTKFYETSFDCEKVKKSSVEYKICTDKELAKLDTILNKTYKSFRLITKEIRQDQRAWIKKRNKCKTKECIKEAYKTRITTLEQRHIEYSKGVFYKDTLVFDYPQGDSVSPVDLCEGNEEKYLYIYDITKDKYIVKSIINKSINNIPTLKFINNCKDVDSKTKITFSDGSKLFRRSESSGGHCSPLLGNISQFILVDANDTIISEKILFRLLDKPVKEEGGFCETEDFEGTFDRYYDCVSAGFYPLENDTFLVTFGGKYVVRFDKNLKTKSELLNKKIFWMDVKEYNSLVKKLNVQTYKDENKMVLDWIKENKRRNKKWQ